MACYEINGLVPVVDPTAFVHPMATLIGDVIVGDAPGGGARFEVAFPLAATEAAPAARAVAPATSSSR